MNLKNMMGALSPVTMLKNTLDNEDEAKRLAILPSPPLKPKPPMVPDILSGGLVGEALRKKNYF